MKKTIYILAIALCMFNISSCKKDFLNTTSPSVFTDDVSFSNALFSEFAVNGIYAILGRDESYSSRLSLTYGANTDIEVAGADMSNYLNDAEYGLPNYNGTPNNTKITAEWNALYKMVERANICINGIKESPAFKGSDSSKMKALLGESMVLRAFAYADLVKYWGDVPFKAEPTLPDASNVYLPATDRDSIYEFIIADLQTAASYLPWLGSSGYSTPERITRGFAEGLLARVALARGGFSIRNKPGFPTERGSDWEKYYRIANAACKNIIDNGTHKLNPSYVSIWKNVCAWKFDSYNENLWEMPFGISSSSELGYSVGIRYEIGCKYALGKANNSNLLSTTAYYLYSFDSSDLRRDVTVAPYTYTASDQEKIQTNPLRFCFGKWDMRWMNETWRSTNKNATTKLMSGINWIAMRYADVLLMYAETENELNGGPTAAAKAALKQVRSRAFNSADQAKKVNTYVDDLGSKDAFFNAIVDERAWEFGGEAVRKFDLIRWNLLDTKITLQREVLTKMINGTAPYDTLPNSLYWKLNGNNEIDKTTWNLYKRLSAAPDVSYTKTGWLFGLSDDNKKTFLPQIESFSTGLNKVKPNRYLFPIPSSVISSSQGKLSNSYGF